MLPSTTTPPTADCSQLPQKRLVSPTDIVSFAKRALTIPAQPCGAQQPLADRQWQADSQKEQLPNSARQEPSNWPDLVLEQIFKALNLSDLAACRQVCRRWHQMAAGHSLQTHCLLQTYTHTHRLRMERALYSNVMHTSRTPGYDSPAVEPGSAPSAHSKPSPQMLLYGAVSRMLQATAFHPDLCNPGDPMESSIKKLLCSPDGRWIASQQSQISRTPPDRHLYLWKSAFTPIHCPPQSVHPDALHNPSPGSIILRSFSPDSRRLRALFKKGDVQVWQQQPGGSWHLAPGARLFEGSIADQYARKAIASPDGQHMALMLRDRVLIHGAGEAGDWAVHPQWSKVFPPQDHYVPMDNPEVVGMRFSDDGRHFVLAFKRQAFICTQVKDSGWSEQPIALPAPFRGKPLFAANSRLLALAGGFDSPQDLAGGFDAARDQSGIVNILFWHFEQKPDGPPEWKPAKALGRLQRSGLAALYDARTQYKVPMAFSPDGQLMALPYWKDCATVFVVPVHGAKAWETGVPLTCGSEATAARIRGAQTSATQSHELVSSMRFSASSEYLAVRTKGNALKSLTLWLWRRCPTWHLVLKIDQHKRHGKIPFAFSPDGCHCVAATVADGRLNRINVWGPVARGEYKCKYAAVLHKEMSVDKVMFTPDATQVLIAVADEGPLLPPRPSFDRWSSVGRLLCVHLDPQTTPGPPPTASPSSQTAPLVPQQTVLPSPPMLLPASEPAQDAWHPLPDTGASIEQLTESFMRLL